MFDLPAAAAIVEQEPGLSMAAQLGDSEPIAAALPKDSPNTQAVRFRVAGDGERREHRPDHRALARRLDQRRGGRRAAAAHEQPMTDLAAITLESPKGGAWELLVLFLVVILGPPIVQRMRIPGIIGLLVGGFLIGPNGLGLLDAGSTTIPDLGQLGLLYLMFVAGVELDLTLLRQYRRSAISFGLLTFSLPMLFGTIAAFAIGWETAAALLLGSLLASHTLVLYPLIRDAKLANDPMVASTVGATVLTDTIALVILAVVAGTQSGSGSGAEIALQIVLGLTVLGLFCFVFLPFVVNRLFRLLGTGTAGALRDRGRRVPLRRGRGGDVPDRGHRRRVLRRAGDRPAGAERGPADDPDRLLRLRAVRAGFPRVGRAAASRA